MEKMDTDEAMELIKKGPQLTLVGIDTQIFSVGPLFKGIKMIPPGPHFVYYSSANREGNEFSPVVGFFIMTAYSEVPYREGIHFDKINDESSYNTVFAYGQSKLANILHANELSKRLKEEGVQITANSLHPGSISTYLLRYHKYIDFVAKTAGKLFLKNVQKGAATSCYVALHPQVKGVSGKYFDSSSIKEASAKSYDAELAKKLWDFSMQIVG